MLEACTILNSHFKQKSIARIHPTALEGAYVRDPET
jgi:hypothetical protein